MYQATITGQGQITIPSEMRKKMGLKPGDAMTFVPQTNDWKEYSVSKSMTWEDLRGVLRPYAKGKPKLTPARLEKLRVQMYTERYKRFLSKNETGSR